LCADNAKGGRGRGLVGTFFRHSDDERRPRTKANAPAVAARATAISDLFGLRPSTDGVAERAFFLPTCLARFQTAQPITALRLLITLTAYPYPSPRVRNHRKFRGRRAGTAPERDEGTSHSTRRRRAEKLAGWVEPGRRAAF